VPIERPLTFAIIHSLSPSLHLSPYSSYLLQKSLTLIQAYRTVYGHPKSKVVLPIDSRVWFPIRLIVTATLYLSSLLKYLTCNFDVLELGQFKFVQDQRSCCQSIAPWWFPVRLLLTSLSPFLNFWLPFSPTLYLSRHSRCLAYKLCDIDLGRLEVTQGQRSSGHLKPHNWFLFDFLFSIFIVTIKVAKYLTCNFNNRELLSSGPFGVKGHWPNRKPIVGFLCNLSRIQLCICHAIWDIWCISFVT